MHVPFQRKRHLVFISYRHADSTGFTDRIYEELKERFGKSVIYRDIHSTHAGRNIKVDIQDAISSCKVVLIIIGTTWANIVDSAGKKRLHKADDLVHMEVKMALDRGKAIPVLVGGASMPLASELPNDIKGLYQISALKVRGGKDFDNDIEELANEIRRHLGYNRLFIGIIFTATVFLFLIMLYQMISKPSSTPNTPMLSPTMSVINSTEPEYTFTPNPSVGNLIAPIPISSPTKPLQFATMKPEATISAPLDNLIALTQTSVVIQATETLAYIQTSVSGTEASTQ